LNPRAEGKIRQGVTTEVVGNCGFSVAPALPGTSALLGDYLGASAPGLPFQDATFAEYLDRFPPVSVNTIMQVGHNTLRLMTVGMERRAATSEELERMSRLLAESLEAGALGLSSGLFTAPGSFAGPDEILALARVLARYGATYASHVRDEANHGFEAVREAIAVAEQDLAEGFVRLQVIEQHVEDKAQPVGGRRNSGDSQANGKIQLLPTSAEHRGKQAVFIAEMFQKLRLAGVRPSRHRRKRSLFKAMFGEQLNGSSKQSLSGFRRYSHDPSLNYFFSCEVTQKCHTAPNSRSITFNISSII